MTTTLLHYGAIQYDSYVKKKMKQQTNDTKEKLSESEEMLQ